MEILKSQPSCLSPGWPMNLSVSVLQEKHRLLCEAHLCTLAQQKNLLPNKEGRGAREMRVEGKEEEEKERRRKGPRLATVAFAFSLKSPHFRIFPFSLARRSLPFLEIASFCFP